MPLFLKKTTGDKILVEVLTEDILTPSKLILPQYTQKISHRVEVAADNDCGYKVGTVLVIKKHSGVTFNQHKSSREAKEDKETRKLLKKRGLTLLEEPNIQYRIITKDDIFVKEKI